MDRADIVPVSLEHPDAATQVCNPELRNLALGVVFSCVTEAAPAIVLSRALLEYTSCRYGRFVGVTSDQRDRCAIFFELTPLETAYVALEVAARKAQVHLVWHTTLTENGFWRILPMQPQLEVLRSVIQAQPC